MKPGEKVIVIAEDDDTYAPRPPADAAPGALPSSTARPPAVETMLFCGWRRDIRDIIHHLDRLRATSATVLRLNHAQSTVKAVERRDHLLTDHSSEEDARLSTGAKMQRSKGAEALRAGLPGSKMQRPPRPRLGAPPGCCPHVFDEMWAPTNSDLLELDLEIARGK